MGRGAESTLRGLPGAVQNFTPLHFYVYRLRLPSADSLTVCIFVRTHPTSDIGVFRPGYCSVTSLTRENGQLKVQQLGGESETRVL